MIVSFGTTDDLWFWQYWFWSIPSVNLTSRSQIFHSWTWVYSIKINTIQHTRARKHTHTLSQFEHCEFYSRIVHENFLATVGLLVCVSLCPALNQNQHNKYIYFTTNMHMLICHSNMVSIIEHYHRIIIYPYYRIKVYHRSLRSANSLLYKTSRLYDSLFLENWCLVILTLLAVVQSTQSVNFLYRKYFQLNI